MSGEEHPEDRYARVDYRRLVAWDARIRREAPFLEALLAEAPERSVLDLGCGTGEHTAFFARQGCRAVGLDSSESMLEKAREHEQAGEGRFVLGDAREAARVLAGEEPFGLAVCLGNMLPHLEDESALATFLREVHRLLLPDGLLLVQILNYHRILEQDVRHLPLNFRAGEGGSELVFLRLMKSGPAGTIDFFPTTLSLDPESEDPVKVAMTRRVRLRAWTASELEPLFAGAGFGARLHGDMQGGAFDERNSSDLVIVASR